MSLDMIAAGSGAVNLVPRVEPGGALRPPCGGPVAREGAEQGAARTFSSSVNFPPLIAENRTLEYYVLRGQQRMGPFTLEQVRAQSLEPTTLVWREGMSAWTAAREVPELTGMGAWTAPRDAPDVAGATNPYSSPTSYSPMGSTRAKLRHSGFGIASSILGIALSLVWISFCVVLSTAIAAANGGNGRQIDEKSREAILLTTVILGCGFGQLVGFILGIVGALQHHRHRVFAYVGLATNSFSLLAIVGLCVIGFLMSQA